MWSMPRLTSPDVGQYQGGASQVTFKVDAFPKETFHGTVNQVEDETPPPCRGVSHLRQPSSSFEKSRLEAFSRK